MSTAELESPTYPIDEQGNLVASRYRTLERIGNGRLGEIFSACDESMQALGVEEQVAVQIVPKSVVRNNRLFNRLNLGYSQLRESRHPNIVEYIRFGRDGRIGYLVMKLLDGASLRTVLNDTTTLPMDEVRPVVHGIGAALRFLHSKSIFHGDLTTQNVFITDELDVRLLDVLPADPTEAVFRANAPGSPQFRYSARDDVFGLACLAYEMLSGRHPFDGKFRAEAKMAGREADRIGSLPDREWQAIRLAVSLNDECQTSSVAEFLHAFGALDAERLQPAVEPPPVQQARPTIPPAPTQMQPRLVETKNTTVDPVSTIDRRPKREQKKGSSLRAIFLAAVLAWLGAWMYFGEPEEHVVSLFDYLDERTDINFVDSIGPSEPRETSDVFVDLPAMEPDPIAVANSEITTDLGDEAAIDEELTIDEQIAEELIAEVAVVEQAISEEKIVAEPIESEEPIVEREQLAAEIEVDQGAAEAEAAITEFVVAASEGDGAARINVPHTINSGAQLIWWTSEHSATGDVDYVSVAQKPLTDASFRENGTLYVPLVNDSLPELQESFFVNIVRVDSRRGQIDRSAAIRVDILDDD